MGSKSMIPGEPEEKISLLKESAFAIQPAFDGSRIESVTLKALM